MFSDAMLSLLPDASRDKLERLISERQSAIDTYRAASDREQAARQEFGLAEGSARQRLSMPAGVSLDVHPAAALARPTKAQERDRTETEERLLAPVEAAKRRLDLALDARERAAQKQSSFAYLEGVQQWLSRAAAYGGMSLRHFAPTPPKAKDASAEIQRLHADLKALDEAWQAAENAPLPAAILRQQAIAEIDAIAKEGELRIHANNRSGEPLGLRRAIRIGQTAVALPGEDRPFMALEGTGGAPLMVWLQRDAIVERVKAMIAALPQAGALSDDERDREFARISTRRLEIERAEEALTVAMEHEGRIVQRRRDLDPRALLEVAEV